MRRELLVTGAVVVAAVAVAVPVLLVARAVPPRTVSELVATPTDYFPVMPVTFNQKYPVSAIPLEQAKNGTQHLEVDTPPFPKLPGPVRLEVRVATYLLRPAQAIHLALLGPRGKPIGSCSFPPSGYHDNSILECPVNRPERLRHIVMTADGPPKLALYAATNGTQLIAGALVRQRHLDSLGARLRVLGRRLGVLRPPLFSPIALFVLLALGTALLGAAWLVAAGTDAQRE
jgi:hypothetical protein